MVFRQLANTHSSIPRGAYAPRSWLHVRMPLQMGDFRRREWRCSHGTVVARQAPKLDSCGSRRGERYFSHGGLTPPLRMYRARLLQKQRERCTIPVHASSERRLHAVGKCVSTAQDVDLNCSKTGRRLHAVGKCVSTAQDVDLNLFQDRPSAPCGWEIRFDRVLLSDSGTRCVPWSVAGGAIPGGVVRLEPRALRL
jgi:hypothetical protein